MKIGLAQFDPTIGAFSANVGRMIELAERARHAGCGLVVFPELSVGGYPARDLYERREFVDECLKALDHLVSSVKGIGVLCGCLSLNLSGVGKPLHNSAFLFEDGTILAKVHKRLLPTYDIFDETRYFEPGAASVPVEYRDLKLGISVCEDIWSDKDLFLPHPYAVDPVQELADRGMDVLINISASPYDINKASARRQMLGLQAAKHRRPIIYVNMVGGQDSLIFDGGSTAIDPAGGTIAQAVDFAEDLVVADTASLAGDIHPLSAGREETVVKALMLGLKDYMRRCGFSRVVLGLSGGIDSSVTAAIAVGTLGPEQVLGVLMPSPYTSAESIEDAQALASKLGIETITLPISDLFAKYLSTMKPVFGDTPHDATEENIQARIRGNLLMAISNKFGHLLLSTGNKSELAVGYCTLYGDMSGGFALLSDVPKTLVYSLAAYLNRDGEVIPERVLTKPPSAELRPGQKDQDTLPPYELIDAVLERYMEQNASPREIIGEGFDEETVYKIVGMVDRNEYKRRQAPFGPRVTSRAFGCGRRYPVAHGYRFHA